MRRNRCFTQKEVIEEDKESDPDPTDLNGNSLRALVGSLLYLERGTRPDIGYAVSVLAQYAAKPKEQHIRAGKRILRYLAGTKDLGLSFEKPSSGTKPSMNDPLTVTATVDADLGGDKDDRKSRLGYVITLNNCLLSWKSQKQSVVVTSTCESEYVGLCTVIKEVKGNTILSQMGLAKSETILKFGKTLIQLKSSYLEYESWAKIMHNLLKLQFHVYVL